MVDGGHGVLTDHSIPRRVGSPAETPRVELRPWPGYESSGRELGLAYAEVSIRTGDDRQRQAALELLTKERPDAEVLVRLAHLLQQKGEHSRAAEMYRQGLALQPNAVTALVNLGVLEARQGRYQTAITLWRRALEANPAQPEAVRNLSTLLKALGRQSEAAQMEATLHTFGE